MKMLKKNNSPLYDLDIIISKKRGSMKTQLSIIIITMLLSTHSYNMDDLKNHIAQDLHQAKQDLGIIIGSVAPNIGALIADEPRAITNNPYKNKIAQVREGIGISEGEKEYLTKRLPIAKAAFEKILNIKLEDKHVPTTAIASSGGGYRALLYTLGFFNAMEIIELLDTITYATALSGSTWAVAPWISSDMSLKEYKKYIIKCVQKEFTKLTDTEELLIFDAARVKSIYHQPKNLVDIYGDLLGTHLLEKHGDKRHMVYLSEQADKIRNGIKPYPIYVAIDANEKIVKNQTWYEFTPHEIGNRIDNKYVPTWAYGRKFKNGKSIDNAPEKNLSYHMGTWGSAFGADVATIEHAVASRLGHQEIIEKILEPIQGDRPVPCYATIANYTRGMNTGKKEPKTQTFVDAGTDFNLPIPPCYNRNIDLIFINDVSAGTIGNELKKAQAHAKRHNYPFPKINYKNLDKQTISIFKDENNSKAPVVIYMPRISDQRLWEDNKLNPQFKKYNLSGFDLDYETNHGPDETIHFQYNKKNAKQTIHQAEFNVRVNQAKILETLQYVIDKKRKA